MPKEKPLTYVKCPQCEGEGHLSISNCCAARIEHGDICSLCEEHCGEEDCQECFGTGSIPVDIRVLK